jgi:hypothetical protein
MTLRYVRLRHRVPTVLQLAERDACTGFFAGRSALAERYVRVPFEGR